MDKVNKILEIAKNADNKITNIEEHMETIVLLRKKGFSWRDMADFFKNNGIEVEHTKLSRVAKANHIKTNLSTDVPSHQDYLEAINSMEIKDEGLEMLLFHFNQPNRTVTYTQLAKSVGHDSYQYTNKVYGALAKQLCKKLNFKPFQSPSGRKFFGSVIGMQFAYAAPKDEFQLVMHHELSKAIQKMNLDGDK